MAADDIVQTSFSDPLSLGGLRFFIKRMPKLSFSVQAATLPSLELASAEYPTPFVSVPYAGDHIAYGELRLTYLVDEKLANYVEIHDWMRALGKPATFDDYAVIKMEPGTGVASDCVLSVLDSKRNPVAAVTLVKAVPTSLSGIAFDARIQGVQYASVTASFRYDEFEIALA